MSAARAVEGFLGEHGAQQVGPRQPSGTRTGGHTEHIGCRARSMICQCEACSGQIAPVRAPSSKTLLDRLDREIALALTQERR
jgi:hypothetical protein